MSNREEQEVQVDEVIVLEKFDGEPSQETLVEKIHIKNGAVVGIDTIRNGKVIASRDVGPDEFPPMAPFDPAKEVD